MTNNDILRRLRYALNLPDGLSLKFFSLGGKPATETELAVWMKKDEDPGYLACRDETLTAFLDGFVTFRRGPRPEGSVPSATERLTNNLILKKLRVALAWQEENVLAAVSAGGMAVSKNELTALFRKPGQKNFKPCGDQLLRAFLTGIPLVSTKQRENPAS